MGDKKWWVVLSVVLLGKSNVTDLICACVFSCDCCTPVLVLLQVNVEGERFPSIMCGLWIPADVTKKKNR